MIAAVVDIETTGTNDTDQIIEIGSYLIDGKTPRNPFHALVAPTIPIPPTSSAVHHIVAEDLLQAPTWPQVSPTWFVKIHEADVMVAHNAAFERRFLSSVTDPRPWVCTMKCAMRAWPDAPGFGNQVLRYWRAPHGLDRLQAKETHRALPDAYVTAFLFRELVAEHPIETLIRWTEEPAMPPRLSFGKHKGTSWLDVPMDYLDWIVTKSDMDTETKATARAYIRQRMASEDDEREEEEVPPYIDDVPPLADKAKTALVYLEYAPALIGMCASIAQLQDWWREEREHRHEYGIVEGTEGYATLVALCAERKTALSPQAHL